jgi:hypothetical protein
MRLHIYDLSGTILDLDDEKEAALIPGEIEERASVFKMLVGALSLLAGLAKRQQSFDATGAGPDLCLRQTERDHGDRMSCDVVRLSARRDASAPATMSFTNGPLDVGCAADRPAHDVDEIEITPEMVDGGISELAHFDSEFESFEEAVIRIYRRMEMVKRECQLLPNRFYSLNIS